MLGPFDLVLPPIVLLTSIATLPFTFVILLLTNATALTSIRQFKNAWFKHFWWWFGPASKPLFTSAIPPILAEASGVVLDVGPASGVWIRDLGQIVKAHPGQITKIYGVEPNTMFHEQLRSNARKHGLEGVYEPVAAYAQDLESSGIKKGSIDTIITVHVLCSVGSHAEKIVRSLYEYLKPGGQWLVYEHVASKHAPVRNWQSKFSIRWESRS